MVLPVHLPMLKISGFLLLILAYLLLWPGITEPMLSISGTVEKRKLVAVGQEIMIQDQDVPALLADLANSLVDQLEVSGSVTAFDKTRSILGTASELRDNGHLTVAILIVLFSVVVPAGKAILLLLAHGPVSAALKRTLLRVSDALSKWSMADVFVVATFMTYLATQGIRTSQALVDFHSVPGKGFWFFLGYCLLSILATQMLGIADRREQASVNQAP